MSVHRLATSMRAAMCGTIGESDIDSRLRLCGWVARRRDHGEHLFFLDLRDHTGVVQCVLERSTDLRSEQVVSIEGTVRRRPQGTANPKIPTGEIELYDCSVEILADAKTPPIQVEGEAEAEESVRLRYRYIDLRRPRMQSNLRLRSKVTSSLRATMERNGFVEVETPLLWSPTPEGAREFAVPSRLRPGCFYVLPQSPQLAKQLLMVGGIDRYYQVARCMRDEDPRADRAFEFTQLDMEASFVTQDDVIALVSEAVADATEAVGGVRPDFATITWSEAMARYGTDKPDLRLGMEIAQVSEVFAATALRAFQAPCVKAILVEGGAAMGRGRIDALVEAARGLGAEGLAWFRVKDASSVDSPLARHMDPAELSGLLERTGAKPGDLVLVVAGEARLCSRVLGQLRSGLGQLGADGALRFVWVVDFPMFEGPDESGVPQAAHHPFTMPRTQDLESLETDPMAVIAQAYDLVVNGWELGSGSVRIHQSDIQSRVFGALGIDEREAQSRFGFLLEAFAYGAPPHAGFAFGIDRLVAVLAGEESIREVIAFPKSQSGADPLTGAPKELSPSALLELGIQVRAARERR
ncbi:MAG: aspartate--tRNA ligase [Acidimicrobiales bacterium]